jgi:hypothetical protein
VWLAGIHRESKNKAHKFTTPPPPQSISISAAITVHCINPIPTHHHKNGQIETNSPQNNCW